MMSRDSASVTVSVKNAVKFYGSKQILNNLCMSVEKGIIYGLLGASGCGKTTLLSCIVGRKSLNSGQIWVLGGQPGTPESGVPGSLVGYMPQDVALVAEFTVQDAIYYFGRIFGMSEKNIEEKFTEFSLLLELPPRDRLIKNCSGGQQRRISFAAALVSSPKLLILDEPTVGLDPVLREKIWNYLVKLSQTKEVAIIITTHYIEETRQANKIGLMRQGKLLAEENPQNLLTRFETDSLEDVFYTLSKQQTNNLIQTTDDTQASTSNVALESSQSSIAMTELQSTADLLKGSKRRTVQKKSASNAFSLSPHRLKALFGKNINQIIKNPSGMTFMIMFPILEILAFFTAVGTDIKDIKLAVINKESYPGGCVNFSYNTSAMPNENAQCFLNGMSCRFLKELEDPMIKLVDYDDLDTAIAAIHSGDITGVMYISSNFSLSLQDRLIYLNNIPAYVFNASQIQCWLDTSNRQVGLTIKYKLIDKIEDLLQNLFRDCNYAIKSGQIPINFKDPAYGHYDDTFTIFMVPGTLITIMFFLGATNTSTIIVTDRLEGVWDRSIVAGVSSVEILLAHTVTQFALIFIQSCIAITITFGIYRVELVGNFGIFMALIIFQGATGMAFGFLVSVLSNSYSMANIIITGGFYPMLLTSGLLWPLEGMPTVLRWIAKCLPCTIPTESLRNVMKKGWSITNFYVIDGLVIEFIWIIVLIVISIWGIKNKQ